MADFLGEGRSRQSGDKSAKRPAFNDVKPPEPPKHQARKAEDRQGNGLKQVAKDFKDGVSSLNAAVERIGKLHTAPKANPQITKPIQPKDKETHKIERVVERVTPVKPPSQSKHTPPQEVKAPREVPATPQVVARAGKNKDVDALIKTAKSEKAGRLPFVPKETRERAERLVAEIKQKSSSPITITPPKHSIRKETSADRGAAKVIQPKAQATTQSTKTKPEFATGKQVDKAPVALSETEARQVERDIPRFRSQGATRGPAVAELDETAVSHDDVSVIYREGSKESARPELSPTLSSTRRDAAVADRRRSTPSNIPQATAAPSTPRRATATSAAATGGNGSAGIANSRAATGNMTIEGTLRIDGIGQGTTSDTLARLNARVVKLEGGR